MGMHLQEKAIGFESGKHRKNATGKFTGHENENNIMGSQKISKCI